MKLKYDFETVDMGGEYISVPVGDNSTSLHGVLKLNKEGKEVVELLRTDITEESIIDIIASKYDNDREIIASRVHKAIIKLREIGVVED